MKRGDLVWVQSVLCKRGLCSIISPAAKIIGSNRIVYSVRGIMEDGLGISQFNVNEQYFNLFWQSIR